MTNDYFANILIAKGVVSEWEGVTSMKKAMRWNRIVAVLVAIVLAVTMIPTVTVQAKGEVWIHPGNGWHYLDGTDIKVHIENGVMRVSGTGALPDYDYWSVDERPWAKANIQHLFVDDTVTALGSYAFYNISTLKYIYMSTKTFIRDTTTFEKIAYKPIFRLIGSEETTEMIGTIPYTSYDSIKKQAQVNYNGACYILDTQKQAKAFQESTIPTIPNVFWAKDTKAPWNSLEDNANGNEYLYTVCKLAAVNPDLTVAVTGMRRYQGMACYQAFAAFIGDYTFATAYQINVSKGKDIITATDTELQYTLTIPAEFRAPGRTFRLLAIGYGVVHIYDDLDSVNETITFATSTPTTAYALVYK